MTKQITFDAFDLTIFCECEQTISQAIFIPIPKKCSNCKSELNVDFYLKDRPIFILPEEMYKEI